MSSTSVVGKLGNVISQGTQEGFGGLGKLAKGDVNGGVGDLWDGFKTISGKGSEFDPLNIWGANLKNPSQDPNAPPNPPDPADATKKALDAQLQNELNIRRSMALVTGGQGIIGQPPTAGQSLIGR